MWNYEGLKIPHGIVLFAVLERETQPMRKQAPLNKDMSSFKSAYENSEQSRGTVYLLEKNLFWLKTKERLMC